MLAKGFGNREPSKMLSKQIIYCTYIIVLTQYNILYLYNISRELSDNKAPNCGEWGGHTGISIVHGVLKYNYREKHLLFNLITRFEEQQIFRT